MLVGKDEVLAEVGPPTGLFDERGRETVRIGDVVHELRVDVVPELPNC